MHAETRNIILFSLTCHLSQENMPNFLSDTRLLEAILLRQFILLHLQKWWILQKWWNQSLVIRITHFLVLGVLSPVVMLLNLFCLEQILFRYVEKLTFVVFVYYSLQLCVVMDSTTFNTHDLTSWPIVFISIIDLVTYRFWGYSAHVMLGSMPW